MSGDWIGGGGLVLAVGGYWMACLTGSWRRHRAESRARHQVGRARAAAAEAALEDEVFAPDQIHDVVEAGLRYVELLLNRAPGASDRADAPVLGRLATSIEQMAPATSRWVFEPAAIEILRVVNRLGTTEDRVLVRVRFVVDERTARVVKFPVLRLDQHWTLGRGSHGWIVLSIDGTPPTSDAVERPSIASPSADDQRLLEQSLAELARSDALPAATNLDQLVSRDAPVYHRLLDLAQIDGRFAPMLIAAAAGHIVEAWEEATTASSQPLEAVASPSAAQALLHPLGGVSTKLALRHAKVDHCRLTDLRLTATSPQIELELEVSAVRYLWSAGAGYAGGSTDRRHTITMTWTLELSDDQAQPWQLLATTNPANQIWVL